MSNTSPAHLHDAGAVSMPYSKNETDLFKKACCFELVQIDRLAHRPT